MAYLTQLNHLVAPWLLWVGLGGGTVAAVVLAFVAPSFLTTLSNLASGAWALLQPLLLPGITALGKGLGDALGAILAGGALVLDNGKELAFVLSAVVIAFVAGGLYQGDHVGSAVENSTVDLHQCFLMTPRKNAPPACRQS